MAQHADIKGAPRSTAGHALGQAVSPRPEASGEAGAPRRPAVSLQLRKQRSLWGNAWRQFRRHRLAMAGLVVLCLLVLATFVGTAVYPIAIDDIDLSLSGGSLTRAHPFGTDGVGRDVLARMLWGGRISIAVGLIAAAVAIIIGTGIGALAGFLGGTVDNLLMRLTDLFISLPQVPLLLVISFLYRDWFYKTFDRRFGDGNSGIFVLVICVIAVLSWMPTARLVRASFLAAKEKEFVEAARAIGAHRHALILRHILPNVMSPIIVAATLGVGAAIITESVLSFLGLGFPSDVPTWGSMLTEAPSRVDVAPHEAIFPGMMVFLTVLAINYIGDGLRDALDPRKTQ